jgi:hypothetical protein
MSPKDIETELLEIIAKTPGITLNGMFAFFTDRLNKKFAPMYKVVQTLRENKIIKIDAKKKNTGHYMADVVIADEGADKPKPPSLRRNVPGTSSDDGDSSVTFTKRYARNKVEDKRFTLEKNEGLGWKTIHSDDIDTPVMRLYEQCIHMVPLRYRVQDTQTGETLIERKETATHEELTTLQQS